MFRKYMVPFFDEYKINQLFPLDFDVPVLWFTYNRTYFRSATTQPLASYSGHKRLMLHQRLVNIS